jgi:acetyl esterase
MSKDPQVQAFLKQLQDPATPKLNSLPPEGARQMYVAMAQAMDAQNVPIGQVENRAIPGPAGEIPIRIYTPVAAGAAPLPVLVYYHGGGWVIGDLNTHDGVCRVLANESGCKVVAVDYRLAPEHPFPAAVDDSFAALQWVADNAGELGVDANRIAVGGDSAGGNLSAVVSQIAKDKGGPRVAFQLLIYPVTDAGGDYESRRANATGYLLEQELMEWFFKHYVPKGTDPLDTRISPLRRPDLAGLPPAWVLTAGFDPLRDEGKAYADKLRAAGVAVEYVNEPEMIHGFFQLSGAIDAGAAALKRAGAVIRAALG